MPKGLPSEVTPLAAEINALIEANLAMVTRARTQAGNLARALKTPLAVLREKGERTISVGKTQAGQWVIDQSVQKRRQIDDRMAPPWAGGAGWSGMTDRAFRPNRWAGCSAWACGWTNRCQGRARG